MTTEEINIKTTFTDEISTRIQGALDTFVEFGASQDQVADAFERINKSSEVGARGIAQTSNALRKLMDETEDASLAMKGLEKSFQVAEAAGIKVEDAAADVGRALKGQTDILNRFDDQAKAAAKSIDGISDPALRARAIMIQLSAATRRQNSLFGKLANQFKFAAAVAPNFTKALKGIALGFAGAGAAITAFVTKSLKSYLEGSARMRKQNERMSKSLKDLEFTFGAIVAQALGMGNGLKSANTQIVSFTKTLKKNRVPIVKVIQNIALASVVAARAITTPIKGLILLFKVVQDGFTELAKGASLLLEGALKGFIALGKLKGKFSDLTALEKQNMTRATEALKQLKATRVKVEPFAGTTEMVDDLSKVGDAFDKLEERFKKFDKDFKIDIPTPPTAGPKKLIGPSTAEEALELAPVRDADMPSLLRELTTEEGLGARFQQRIAEMSSDTKSLTDVMLGGKQASKELGDAIEGTGAIADRFAQESVQMMVGALDGFVFALAKGGDSMKDFGKGLLLAFGDLTSQIGQALVLLSLGVGKISTGDFTGALGIGLGLIAFGAALKGFASRTSGAATTAEGADGSTARALERFGRRLFEREDPSAGREVVINIDGRQMRGFVVDSVNNAVRARQVPALRRST